MCRVVDSSGTVSALPPPPPPLTFKPHHPHLAAPHPQPLRPPPPAHTHLQTPAHLPPLHHTLPLNHHVHLHPRTPLLARLQPHLGLLPPPTRRRQQLVPRQPPRPPASKQDTQLLGRPLRARCRVQQRTLSGQHVRAVRQRPPALLHSCWVRLRRVGCGAFAPWPAQLVSACTHRSIHTLRPHPHEFPLAPLDFTVQAGVGIRPWRRVRRIEEWRGRVVVWWHRPLRRVRERVGQVGCPLPRRTSKHGCWCVRRIRRRSMAL